jgi:hypothetical protein
MSEKSQLLRRSPESFIHRPSLRDPAIVGNFDALREHCLARFWSIPGQEATEPNDT